MQRLSSLFRGAHTMPARTEIESDISFRTSCRARMPLLKAAIAGVCVVLCLYATLHGAPAELQLAVRLRLRSAPFPDSDALHFLENIPSRFPSRTITDCDLFTLTSFGVSHKKCSYEQ